MSSRQRKKEKSVFEFELLCQILSELSRGSLVGRFPGFKGLLQPAIDPGLISYQPVMQPLQGNYTLTSSDVLAVLPQQWIAAFMLI